MPSVSRGRSPCSRFGPGLVLTVIWALFWSDGVSAQTNGALPDHVINEFGTPPATPDGPLPAALHSAMQVAFVDSFAKSSWEDAQTAALAVIVASGDPRVAWLVSDMMRFVSASGLNETLANAAADLLDIAPPPQPPHRE